jgi:preprotein translocase subunit SecG
MMLPLAKLSFLMNVFVGLFIVIALLLMLVILIQKGKGGGVGSMFGGLGASSLLGSKTGDFLTWVTIGLVSLFLVLAVLMDKYLKTQTAGDLRIPPTQSAPDQIPAQGQQSPSPGQNAPAAEQPAQPAAPAAPAEPAAQQPQAPEDEKPAP